MSEAFYQRFLSFFGGFIVLVFMFLVGAEFMFFYSLSGNFIFYYSSMAVFAIVIVYASKYYGEFRDFKETLGQSLYFPNSNNEKALNPMSKPLNIDVEDLSLKACLHYRNGYSFKRICYKLQLGREPQTAKRLVIKGLDILLKEYHEKEVKTT